MEGANHTGASNRAANANNPGGNFGFGFPGQQL